MYFVYEHIRPDTNEIFYIGIGTKKLNTNCFTNIYHRAYSKRGRNNYWKHIVNQNKNYQVNILFDYTTKEEAISKEIELISLHGRKDLKKGPLCNLTDGGDGLKNVSETSRKLMSDNCSFRKMPNFNARKVYQYNQKGDFIAVYPSILNALTQNNLGKNHHSIRVACLNNEKTAYGYKWFFNYQGKTINPFLTAQNKGKHLKTNRSLLMKVYNKYGELLGEFTKIRELTSTLNIPQNTVYKFKKDTLYIHKDYHITFEPLN